MWVSLMGLSEEERYFDEIPKFVERPRRKPTVALRSVRVNHFWWPVTLRASDVRDGLPQRVDSA